MLDGRITQSISSERVDFDETENTPSEIEFDRDLPESDTAATAEPNEVNSDSKSQSNEPEIVEVESSISENRQTASSVQQSSEEGVSKKEIEQLARNFNRSCQERRINIDKCNPQNAIVGASIIRFPFKLGRGQSIQSLRNQLEDIGREMRRSGVLVQDIPNSDESYLDVPRLKREKVLFSDVINSIPNVTSPEQLFFTLGRTPDGKDVFKNLADCPHLLVGGSTGSGKTVFLFTLLSSLLLSHPTPKDMQL